MQIDSPHVVCETCTKLHDQGNCCLPVYPYKKYTNIVELMDSLCLTLERAGSDTYPINFMFNLSTSDLSILQSSFPDHIIVSFDDASGIKHNAFRHKCKHITGQ